MLKYLFLKPRTWPRLLFLTLCLAACVSWLALWCFRKPLPRDAVSTEQSLAGNVSQQGKMPTASVGVYLPPKMDTT
jgi:hypothetical protein